MDEARLDAICQDIFLKFGVTVSRESRLLIVLSIRSIVIDPSSGWELQIRQVRDLQVRAESVVEPVLQTLAQRIKMSGQSHISYYDVMHAIHKLMDRDLFSFGRIPGYPVDP